MLYLFEKSTSALVLPPAPSAFHKVNQYTQVYFFHCLTSKSRRKCNCTKSLQGRKCTTAKGHSEPLTRTIGTDFDRLCSASTCPYITPTKNTCTSTTSFEAWRRGKKMPKRPKRFSSVTRYYGDADTTVWGSDTCDPNHACHEVCNCKKYPPKDAIGGYGDSEVQSKKYGRSKSKSQKVTVSTKDDMTQRGYGETYRHASVKTNERKASTKGSQIESKSLSSKKKGQREKKAKQTKKSKDKKSQHKPAESSESGQETPNKVAKQEIGVGMENDLKETPTEVPIQSGAKKIRTICGCMLKTKKELKSIQIDEDKLKSKTEEKATNAEAKQEIGVGVEKDLKETPTEVPIQSGAKRIRTICGCKLKSKKESKSVASDEEDKLKSKTEEKTTNADAKQEIGVGVEKDLKKTPTEVPIQKGAKRITTICGCKLKNKKESKSVASDEEDKLKSKTEDKTINADGKQDLGIGVEKELKKTPTEVPIPSGAKRIRTICGCKIKNKKEPKSVESDEEDKLKSTVEKRTANIDAKGEVGVAMEIDLKETPTEVTIQSGLKKIITICGCKVKSKKTRKSIRSDKEDKLKNETEEDAVQAAEHSDSDLTESEIIETTPKLSESGLKRLIAACGCKVKSLGKGLSDESNSESKTRKKVHSKKRQSISSKRTTENPNYYKDSCTTGVCVDAETINVKSVCKCIKKKFMPTECWNDTCALNKAKIKKTPNNDICFDGICKRAAKLKVDNFTCKCIQPVTCTDATCDTAKLESKSSKKPKKKGKLKCMTDTCKYKDTDDQNLKNTNKIKCSNEICDSKSDEQEIEECPNEVCKHFGKIKSAKRKSEVCNFEVCKYDHMNEFEKQQYDQQQRDQQQYGQQQYELQQYGQQQYEQQQYDQQQCDQQQYDQQQYDKQQCDQQQYDKQQSASNECSDEVCEYAEEDKYVGKYKPRNTSVFQNKQRNTEKKEHTKTKFNKKLAEGDCISYHNQLRPECDNKTCALTGVRKLKEICETVTQQKNTKKIKTEKKRCKCIAVKNTSDQVGEPSFQIIVGSGNMKVMNPKETRTNIHTLSNKNKYQHYKSFDMQKKHASEFAPRKVRVHEEYKEKLNQETIFPERTCTCKNNKENKELQDKTHIEHGLKNSCVCKLKHLYSCLCKGNDLKSPSICKPKELKSPGTSRAKESKSPCICKPKEPESPCTCKSRDTKSPCICKPKELESPCTCKSRDTKSPCISKPKEPESPCTCKSRDTKSPCICKPKELESPCTCKSRDTKSPCISKQKESESPCTCKSRDTKSPCISKPKEPESPCTCKSRDTKSPCICKPKESKFSGTSRAKDSKSPCICKPKEPESPCICKSRDTKSPCLGKPREPNSPCICKPTDPRSPDICKPKQLRSPSISKPNELDSKDKEEEEKPPCICKPKDKKSKTKTKRNEEVMKNKKGVCVCEPVKEKTCDCTTICECEPGEEDECCVCHPKKLDYFFDPTKCIQMPLLNVNLESGTMRIINAEDVREKVLAIENETCDSGVCSKSLDPKHKFRCRCTKWRLPPAIEYPCGGSKAVKVVFDRKELKKLMRNSKHFHHRSSLHLGIGGGSGTGESHPCATCQFLGSGSCICKYISKCSVITNNIISKSLSKIRPKGKEAARREELQKNVHKRDSLSVSMSKDKKPLTDKEVEETICECNREMLERKKQEEKKNKPETLRAYQKRKKKQAKLKQKREQETAKWRQREIQKINKSMGKTENNCCVDLIMGTLKLTGSIALSLIVILFKFIRDPKKSIAYLKARVKDPENTYIKLRDWFKQHWELRKLKIQSTIAGSEALTILKDEIEARPIYQSLRKGKDEKTLKKQEASGRRRDMRMRKRKNEALTSCRHMMLTTLRKTPCLWFYYFFPDFYPQCLSCLGLAHDVLNVFMFCLAILCWTPCILCMELVRGIGCCMLCTA